MVEKYVPFDITPEELADKLTRVGLEVEGIKHQGEGISGVVTGKVMAIERNPKSDHLWVCQLDEGTGELVQIQTRRRTSNCTTWCPWRRSARPCRTA